MMGRTILAPRSAYRGGPVYRSWAPTPKTLAEHLAKRCFRELRPSITMEEARATRVYPTKYSSPVRYLFTKVFEIQEGSQEFLISEQHLEKGMFGWNYSEEWVAQIVVTPDLDVIVHDQRGNSDREKIERIVLDCAMRGPD